MLRPARSLVLAILSSALLACSQEGATPDPGGKGGSPPGDPAGPSDPDDKEDVPGEKKIQPPVAAEKAPPPSDRQDAPGDLAEAAERIDSYFEGQRTHRMYIQVDKPMYQPGEIIWVKTWDLVARELKGPGRQTAHTYQLKSPKGAVVTTKRVKAEKGYATNDFALPPGARGGEYTVVVHGPGGSTEKKVLVSSYEPPRIKKKLEFVRKAYGPGETVQATVVVKRPTGEPLADHPVRARVRLDGRDLEEVRLKTNAEGGGLVKVKLPDEIEVGDGLLTVLVDDGGITESVSKRVPIVLKKVRLSLFPEGGQPVTGLESRVYFEAKNPLNKPADVEGEVVDDHGNVVARLRSHWGGLGRFTYQPQPERRYEVRITKPAGVKQTFSLPLAAREGCTLRHFDDLDGQQDAVRVSVRCSEARPVGVVAVMRDQVLDTAFVEVPEGEPAVVYLKPDDESVARGQGVARVTVLDADKQPLAERLVYRNRRSRLQVDVKPNRQAFMPRDQVSLTVTTKDLDGEPVPAEVALSVVDDTVVSFADDKSGHILSRLFLEQEIPGDPLEEPKFFLDLTEEKSALALDLVMGTRGYRRFAWQPVFAPPPPTAGGGGIAFRGGRADEGLEMAASPPRPEAAPAKRAMPKGAVVKKKARPKRAEARRARPAPAPPPAEKPALAQARAPGKRDRERFGAKKEAKMMAKPMNDRAAGPPMDRRVANEPAALARDDDFADAMAEADIAAPARARRAVAWAPVRVFPEPKYGGTEVTGPRTDFRETIHWAPSVRTDRHGQATVSFYLSDAVTSFRVFTEGVGGGLVGRGEDVIKSSLPFSMNVKLPLAVSAGDKLKLPLTLTNERTEALGVELTATFGELLKVSSEGALAPKQLAAQARDSVYLDVDVTGTRGESEVRFAADAGGLKDEFTRTVSVEPLGFPQEASASGQVGAKAKHTFDLKGAEAGTMQARVQFYPSPVSTMVSGLEGLLRQPHGCFEQASSSNYPNVMILQQLQLSGDVAPQLMKRTQGFLDAGYKKLTGYESQSKGYEWFGGDPGHEALTAYGLLEFIDMKGVYGVDQGMIDRTANWLMSRRDGEGGYKRNSKALDSFGRASPEVTNGYITWALSEAEMASKIPAELDSQKKVARSTDDAYLLGLAANSLLNHGPTRTAGKEAARRLARLQDDDGAFKKADHSITRSGGRNLHIETTALATLALLKAGDSSAAGRAVKWLMNNRGGYGQWGATQATVLSLKALTRYANQTRQAASPGTVIVKVNGEVAARQNYEAGRKEPMVFDDIGSALTPGENRIELLHDGKGELPYSVALEWRTTTPASSEQAVVDLETRLEKSQVKMGETVRAWAKVTNKTSRGQPMTLVRVGLPGGLTFQNWQLKELREQKKIAFFETRPREVILYFRDMKPSEVKEIPLDLVATVPGSYTGPASRAYLYYTDEHKVWTEPFQVEIQPG